MARASMSNSDGEKPKRVSTKIIIRIDHTALARGHVEPGEVCDIPGTGPIPVTHVRDLLADGDAFAAVIATDHTGNVTTVAHSPTNPSPNRPAWSTRSPSGATTSPAPITPGPPTSTNAAPWTGPTRRVPSRAATYLANRIDHRVDRAREHRTQLDEPDGYCKHHHALKTRANYQLAPGTGRRPMHPPTGTDPP